MNKYRAWLIEKKIMADVILLSFGGDGSLWIKASTGNQQFEWYRPDQFILMLSIKLKDLEIFEGDIFAIEGHINHVVIFKYGMFCWGNVVPYSPIRNKINDYNCEIIGNKYENPELLRGLS